MSIFCAIFFSTKKLQTKTVSTQKLRLTLSYKKAAGKMLMKWGMQAHTSRVTKLTNISGKQMDFL